MTADEIVALLRENEPALRQRGVEHVALFGSAASGSARATSDIDIFVKIDPHAPVGIFEYVGIERLIAEILPGPVDVSEFDQLKDHVRPSAEKNAVYAF